MQILKQFYYFVILCLVLQTGTSAVQTMNIDGDDSSITADVYAAKGDLLYIWLPPEGGFQTAHHRIAQSLNSQQIEVWLVDLFEGRFLPPVASSLEKIPDSDIAAILARAQQSGKRVVLLSSGRGIFPLLRGSHYWQRNQPDSTMLAGVILLSPQFYLETPVPGEDAILHPIVERTNLTVFILQPKLSPWFWKLEQTVPALQRSGSDVFTRIVPSVRDRFYYRADASSAEIRLTTLLPDMLSQAGHLLTTIPYRTRSVNEPAIAANTEIKGKKDHKLRPYAGDPRPPSLLLADLGDKQQDLSRYQGRVILVNFWASWCPPCVHEMPSMQRLADNLGPEKFIILAVNMAEDTATIDHFLKTKISVTFPILRDHDGSALKRWNVFAFPTSYIIDKSGNIRYAVFGSVEWDSPAILNTITALINEQ